MKYLSGLQNNVFLIILTEVQDFLLLKGWGTVHCIWHRFFTHPFADGRFHGLPVLTTGKMVRWAQACRWAHWPHSLGCRLGRGFPRSCNTSTSFFQRSCCTHCYNSYIKLDSHQQYIRGSLTSHLHQNLSVAPWITVMPAHVRLSHVQLGVGATHVITSWVVVLVSTSLRRNNVEDLLLFLLAIFISTLGKCLQLLGPFKKIFLFLSSPFLPSFPFLSLPSTSLILLLLSFFSLIDGLLIYFGFNTLYVWITNFMSFPWNVFSFCWLLPLFLIWWCPIRLRVTSFAPDLML